MSAIANVYYNLILKNRKTIEDVPETVRDEVQALLVGEDTVNQAEEADENEEEKG